MSDWEDRVQDFWAGADDSRPEEALERMRELAAERGMESPEACYEWASVHDFLGLEDEAIRWYEQALHQGLEGDRRPQALVQLASSLRNVGRSGDAIALLGSMTPEPVTARRHKRSWRWPFGMPAGPTRRSASPSLRWRRRCPATRVP